VPAPENLSLGSLGITVTGPSVNPPKVKFDFPDGSSATRDIPAEGLSVNLLFSTVVKYASGGAPAYVGPLDLVPGAVAAYSAARAMSAAWIGQNVIKLRRASDDALLDFVAGVDGSVDVAAVATWAGGDAFCHTLYDQSGNGDNAVQATAADQPEWVAAGINGKPGLDFTAGFLATAGDVTLCTAGAMTMFVAAKTTVDIGTANVAAQILGMDFENWNSQCVGDWTLQRQSGFTTKAQPSIEYSSDQEGDTLVIIHADNLIASDVTTASLQTAFLYDFAVSFDTTSVKINGADWTTLVNTSGGSVGAMTDRIAIGANDAVTPGDRRFPGIIAELLPYNGIGSNPNRLAIRQNIAAYYEITL
jgi:hypothetical protein